MRKSRPLGLLLAAALGSMSLTLAAGSAAGVTAVTATRTGSPSAMINSVARALLVAIDAHRDEYRTNSAALDKLVRDLLLPHLDGPLAAELVLGRRWTTATPAQRARFTDTFIRSMVRNSTTLPNYWTSVSVACRFFLYHGDLTADDAQVDTVVLSRSSDRTNVRYSLRNTKQGWKVYDMTFDGVSYVESFRDDFREEIEQKGLDQLISRLESEQR
jgi:phospholipid transport system substrate-binding protein